MFLILVDAHCKWLEVHTLTTATSQSTIEKLRVSFGTQGLPEIFVTYIGTIFTSTEFETFLSRNGIKHLTSAPYHQATNRFVERAVQTLKTAIKKADPSVPLETAVSLPVYIPTDATHDNRDSLLLSY